MSRLKKNITNVPQIIAPLGIMESLGKVLSLDV